MIRVVARVCGRTEPTREGGDMSTWLDALPAVAGLAVGAGAGFVPSVRRWYTRQRSIRRRLSEHEERLRSSDAAFETGQVQTSDGPDVEAAIKELSRRPSQTTRSYLTALELTDFRCFRQAIATFRFPGETTPTSLKNVNLLLGLNGAGKSSVLKAIAMVCLGPILDVSGFIPYKLIRIGSESAALKADFVLDTVSSGPRPIGMALAMSRQSDFERITATYSQQDWSDLFDETNPAFFVVGYGINRRVASNSAEYSVLQQSSRRKRYQRVASLFDESAVLTPLESWVPNASKSRRQEITQIIAGLLPPDIQFSLTINDDGPVFRVRGTDIPFRALSDGYRSFLGWVGDLLFQMDAVTADSVPLRDLGGVVLVDEVDLLLHPGWQRNIVPAVSAMFPNLQFIFTSHSPIVAGSLEPDNILLSHQDVDGASTLARFSASIRGLNAEQILQSDYFRLESSRSPEVVSALGVLARRAMEGDDRASIDYLRALAAGSPPPETTDPPA